jgi:hypothetical protein
MTRPSCPQMVEQWFTLVDEDASGGLQVHTGVVHSAVRSCERAAKGSARAAKELRGGCEGAVPRLARSWGRPSRSVPHNAQGRELTVLGPSVYTLPSRSSHVSIACPLMRQGRELTAALTAAGLPVDEADVSEVRVRVRTRHTHLLGCRVWGRPTRPLRLIPTKG